MNELKPVAWMFQHEETGVISIVDIQQVEWGFEKNNPRLLKIGPLYAIPDTHRVVSVEDLNAIIANHDFFMVKFYGTIDFDPSIARDRLRAIIDNKGATE